MTETGLFGSESAPYGSFKGIGTHYEGTVVAIGQVQSRAFVPPHQRAAGKQGALEFWPDGKPKMTAIVTIQTNQRDPSLAEDDGRRSIWIKGKSMTDAVKAAIKAAGAQREGIVPGGYFSMTFTHETPPEFDGGSPTKHYQVEYRKPTAQGSSDEVNIVGGASTPAPAPQAAQQAPAAGNGASGQPQMGGFDVSSLTPDAQRALAAMLAQQQSGQPQA